MGSGHSTVGDAAMRAGKVEERYDLLTPDTYEGPLTLGSAARANDR